VIGAKMNNQLENYVLERLKQFPTLAQILGESWLSKQLKKDRSQWNLITGWLATQESDPVFTAFSDWLTSLDGSLTFLHSRVDKNKWSKLGKKVRAHADRENTKGTLSEIALCVFLAQQNLPFEMEKQLDPVSNRDVDFAVLDPNGSVLNIEMHWLGESDHDKRLNQISAGYGGMPYPLSFGKMKSRIQDKILEKARKFTHGDITLIAFNVTDDPINGNSIYEAFEEALKGANNAAFQIVDGIIWFEMTAKEHLELKKRGVFINDMSPFAPQIHNSLFHNFWIHD
jgi:hypothetical protein